VTSGGGALRRSTRDPGHDKRSGLTVEDERRAQRDQQKPPPCIQLSGLLRPAYAEASGAKPRAVMQKKEGPALSSRPSVSI